MTKRKKPDSDRATTDDETHVDGPKDSDETKPIVMTPELPPSSLATTRPDRTPLRDEEGTKPFELPPREAATPHDGVPMLKDYNELSTKPLEMPRRLPAQSKPVTIELVEETSGLLSRPAKPTQPAQSSVDRAANEMLEASNPVTVELVEEQSGVLSAAPGASAHPLPSFDDTKADKPAIPLSTLASPTTDKPAVTATTSTDTRADKPAAATSIDTRADKHASTAASAETNADRSATGTSAEAKADKPGANADRPAAGTTSTDAKSDASAAAATTSADTKTDRSAAAATSADPQTDRAAAVATTSTSAAATTAAAATNAGTQTDRPAAAATTSTSAAATTAAAATASTSAAATTAAAASTAADASTAAAATTSGVATTSTAVDADDIEESETSTDDTTGKADEELVPWVAPDDGFQLAGEVGSGSSAVPLVPNPPILPSPQEAALEAARIVSQMVDIDSESGAVIAAAAAAGAAIEAAKAAHKASGVDPRTSQPNLRVPPEVGVQVNVDPITTVRLSRDRILAALASEDIAVPVPPSARESQRMPPVTDAGVSGRLRARTEPGIEEEAYEDFDPVAIAAAAIGRLRQRARTDLAELRVHYHRHDILVLLLALVIILVVGRVHRNMVTPPTQAFSERGLTFEHPTSWLRPELVPLVAPRLVRDPTGGAQKDDAVYHVELSAVGSTAKLEVLIDKKPTWSNIVTGLELDRRSRWGELYTLDASSVRSIAGHDWLRTAYRYAHVAEKGDIPRVDHAIEYATIDREQIYVVTIFGTPLELDEIEEVVSPSLRVPSQTGLPLVPQTGRLSQRKFPGPVGRAFDSTVMVVVADLVDGRLKARGGGSGVIVGGEGSILTNYHVIHDKDGRLHDVFVIGRFSAPDKAPQLQCAGRPSRSKLLRELDLALIKCDMDLDGRSWSPTSSGVWATLPEARAADVKIGQRLWVLGYPDVGGGGLILNVGEVEGWTGEDGAQGKDFIKTDASITHGNSGGPVIDDQGRLVGVASAFRTRVSASGGVIEMSQIGLVRPLQTASNLLAYAAAGWTPREGYTDVELTPGAVEAAAEGVRIFTTVIDDANEQPVRDATVMVLKAGLSTSGIDMNRLDDQAIAWGKTNALGEVRLKQLVPPGTYTVMVVAPGYEPLIGDSELRLDANTPPSFDPWGKIGLRSR